MTEHYNDIIEVEESENGETYEHHKFVVDKGQTPMRIDKFLTNRMMHLSRNRLQSAIDEQCILVNGKAAKASYPVKPCDEITVVLSYPPRELEIIPENIPLNILYEDDDVLVINKVAGMVVHPGHGNFNGTLVNALTYYLSNLPAFQEGNLRAGLVHRIDKDTSGIMVIAKTEKAHVHLAKQFFDHSIERLYQAIVWGIPQPTVGTIEGNIGRSPSNRIKMQIFPEGDQGKTAITHYRVIEDLGYISVVECKLETGRTHQIRAHMEYIGHPLFSDERYGGSVILRGTTFTKYKQFVDNCFQILPRQALHAKVLGFVHPTTGEKLHFEAALPDDMQSVLTKWRTYIASRTEL
ncbi:MAG: RluA family pseudouridine synthase [Bacteroidales bacterium]